MSFDGLARPSALNPYTNPLSASLGANEAARDARGKPRVQRKRSAYETIASHKDLARYGLDEDERGDGLSDEERQQVLRFARLRGLMNFSLENGVLYRFQYNEASGRAELVDARDQRVMLSMTIDELLSLSQRMVRYAGIIADKSA